MWGVRFFCMNHAYSPTVNALARLLMFVGLMCYGWFAGELAGLLAMGFVVCFLAFGLRAVVGDGVVCSAWAAVKWFLYFLCFYFVLFCVNEPLSDEVLAFLSTTISGIASWIRRMSVELRLGVVVVLSIVVVSLFIVARSK